jgi:hypothetical protein
MSSTTPTRPLRSAWRHRFVALAATAGLALTGMAVLAVPADAANNGASIHITDSADPVAAGASYTYHITGIASYDQRVGDPNYNNGVKTALFITLSGNASAGITAMTASAGQNPQGCKFNPGASSGYCVPGELYGGSSFTMTVTATAATAGIVTVQTSLFNVNANTTDAYATSTTTVTNAPKTP